MSDVIDAIARIGVEFRALNLDVPAAILLKDHDQGMRVLHQLHQCDRLMLPLANLAGNVIEHPDGSAWMEVEVYGIRIRWPAARLARQSGGFVFT